jgi:hypothetical protein
MCPEAYTHKLYVDFSGDDGDPSTPGANKSMCIAWILSAIGDIRYNQGIVLQMKKVIGCRPNAELKYTSLKRHAKKMEALQLLSKTKIRVVLVPVLKTRIKEEELRSPRTKMLVAVIHYFPFIRFGKYLNIAEDKLCQLVFDEFSWVSCREEIIKLFKNTPQIIWKVPIEECLRFVKSTSNLMLQLADVVAGLGHEYIESLYEVRLPSCAICVVKGKPERPCRYKLKEKTLPNDHLMRLLYPLLLKEDEVWENGFVVRPPGASIEYKFIDCIFGENQQKKRPSGRALSSQPKPAS